MNFNHKIMKNILKLFALLAITALVFACAKEELPETPEAPENTETPAEPENPGDIENPEESDEPQVNPDGTITLCFSLGALETKTSWDKENGHQWSEGDQIKIIWGPAEEDCVVADVVEGAVTANVMKADTYYAVYPENTVYSLVQETTSEEERGEGAEENEVATASENTTKDIFKITIPKYQDGSFKQANIMAAKTSYDAKTLNFKNITHIIKFNLSEGCKYNLFRFRSNSTGDDVRMAATPSLITFDENDDDIDDMTVGIPESGEGNTGYAVVKLAENATGPYYLGVRAGTDFEGGFGILASKTGKEGDYTGGYLTTNTLEATRSVITDLSHEKPLDYYISDDWYITSTGRGSGKSWADPAGIELLVKLMKNLTSTGETYVGNGTTDIYRLIDAKIHIAAGTYNIFEANNGASMDVAGLAYNTSDRYKSTKITIIGGYSASPSEGDTPTIGEDGSETIFTTNLESNNRVFYFNGTTIGYLVFEGISFKTSGVNAVGNVYFANNVKGSATFNNCYFSVQSTNTNNGAALRVNAGSSCTIELNNCKFVGNSGTKGGAFSKTNTAANVTFNECDFTSNTATGDGGALLLIGAKNVTFNKCNFTENKSGKNNSGGAAYISDDGADVKFENCNFKANDANSGGSIFITSAAKATFIGCSFDSHDTGAGGAISNKVATLIVDNCSFTNNYATTNGGAILTYGEGLDSPYSTIDGKAYTYIYNSLFDNNDVSSSNQGGTLKVHGNSNFVLVNSTVRNSSASTGIIRLRSQVGESVKAWIIGCTFSENNKNSLYNQSSRAYVYNTIMNDATSFIANQTNGGTSFWNTILYNTSYYNIASGELPGNNAITTLTDMTTLQDSVVGSFADGVYSVSGAALTDGMSSTELSELGATGSALMTAMPLFNATKLTVDQKGNLREGKTIMGAYVGK